MNILPVAIIVLSIIFQFLAAILALDIIRVSGRKTAWVLLSAALFLMIVRRVSSLATLDVSARMMPFDFFDVIGLAISTLMLVGGAYIRQYFVDIYQVERERQEAYEFLQTTIDGVAEPVMVIGVDYQVRLMNRIYREQYAPKSKGIPLTCYALSHHRETPCDGLDHPCPLAQVSQTLMPVTMVHEHQTADGGIRVIELLASPLFNNTGQLIGIVESSRDITERKLAERALVDSEARWRALVENAPATIAMLDCDGTILSINRTTSAYTPQEVIGKNVYDFVPPESRERLQEATRRVLETGQAERYENMLARPDGRQVWYDNSIGALKRGEGIEALIHVAIDITERKQAEMDRQAHEQYQAKLNEITQAALKSPDFAGTLKVLTEQMGHIIEADNCYITLWDNTRQEAIPVAASGQEHDEYSHLPHEAGEGTLTGSVLQAGHPLIVEDVMNSPYINPEIAVRFPSCSLLGLPLRSSDKDLGACLLGFDQPHSFTLQEIQHCEQAAAQISLAIAKAHLLEETQRRAEELQSLTQVSTAMRTAQSRSEIVPVILSEVAALFNAEGAALGLHDTSGSEIVIESGHGKWQCWAGKHIPAGQGVSWQVVASGQPYVTQNFKDDDLYLWPELKQEVQCAICAPLIANEQTLGVLWLGRQNTIDNGQARLLVAIADMTANALQRQILYEDLRTQLDALHQAQERLLQSEKLAAVGELVAGVAHELNNPLTAVVLYAQLMHEQTSDAKTAHDLGRIVSESLRAAKIVRGLLDFARQRPAERRPVQVNQVISDSLEFVDYEMRTHNVRWEKQLAVDLPPTLADPIQLRQVFVNLSTNAWQAMYAAHNSGNLWVSTEVGPSLFLGAQQDAPRVIRMIFRDDGPGIPSDLISRIFDPFFTTKPEGQGTGLGLPICHGIISEHGGHIWAESQHGQGAAFFVELPILDPNQYPALTAPGQAAEPPAVAGVKHILVIDDEAAILDVMARTLRRKGYQVDTASDGTVALARLYRMNYDLILCDVRMPELSGPDLYRQVQQKDPLMAGRIIFTTGDILSPATRQFLEETGAPHLAKPFELEQLVEKVRQALS